MPRGLLVLLLLLPAVAAHATVELDDPTRCPVPRFTDPATRDLDAWSGAVPWVALARLSPELGHPPVTRSQGTTVAPIPAPSPRAAPAKAPKKPTPVVFKPYGYIELVTQYEDVQFFGEDGPVWVNALGLRALDMTARMTRFGTDILFPEIKPIRVIGKLEADFAGDFADSPFAESRPQLRMRHATLDLVKDVSKQTVAGMKVGSTWSIVGPLFPSMLGTTCGWGLGNPWQRQPQIQGYVDHKVQTTTIGAKFAATRAMTGDSITRSTNISPAIDAGDAACMPLWEGEVHYDGKIAPFTLYVSLSGLYGKEDYTGMTAKKVGVTDYKMVGPVVNTDAEVLALRFGHEYFALTGEVYSGENIDLFGSALLSGVKYVRNDATKVINVLGSTKTHGGWAQFTISPQPRPFNFNVGYGIDDPEDFASNIYKWNSVVWISVFQTFLEKVTVSTSWLHIHTRPTGSFISRVGNHTSLSFKLDF